MSDTSSPLHGGFLVKRIIIFAENKVKHSAQILSIGKELNQTMDLKILIGPIIGIAIIFALIKIIELPFWLLKNSIVGAIILYAINFIGLFTIKVTFIHCLIVGVFGVPGIIILYVYLNYLK